MNINKEIENNYHLLKKIEELTSKIKINSNNERDYLFAAFYRNSLIHYYSINILVEKKLNNSAFALVRILFENIVKANYLYNYLNDSEINTLINNKDWKEIFPHMEKMCIKFPKIDKINQSIFKHIKNKTYPSINDFIHTGYHQIASNFNYQNKEIASNFKDEEISDMLNLINLIILPSIKIYMDIGINQNDLTSKEVESLFLFMESKYDK